MAKCPRYRTDLETSYHVFNDQTEAFRKTKGQLKKAFKKLKSKSHSEKKDEAPKQRKIKTPPNFLNHKPCPICNMPLRYEKSRGIFSVWCGYRHCSSIPANQGAEASTLPEALEKFYRIVRN